MKKEDNGFAFLGDSCWRKGKNLYLYIWFLTPPAAERRRDLEKWLCGGPRSSLWEISDVRPEENPDGVWFENYLCLYVFGGTQEIDLTELMRDLHQVEPILFVLSCSGRKTKLGVWHEESLQGIFQLCQEADKLFVHGKNKDYEGVIGCGMTDPLFLWEELLYWMMKPASLKKLSPAERRELDGMLAEVMQQNDLLHYDHLEIFFAYRKKLQCASDMELVNELSQIQKAKIHVMVRGGTCFLTEEAATVLAAAYRAEMEKMQDQYSTELAEGNALYNRMQEATTSLEEPETFQFTEGHREALRQLTVIWDASENGAPITWPAYSLESLRMIGTLLNLPDIVVEDRICVESPSFEKLRRELGYAFEIFMGWGDLAEGEYSYDNPLADFDEEVWYKNSFGRETMPIEKDRQIAFGFRMMHQKLIHCASSLWLSYYDLPGINSKRPYGGNVDFPLDMAEVLELPVLLDETGEKELSSAVRKRLEAVHYGEMLYAVQLFLYQGRLVPGLYRRANAFSPWEPI